MCPEITPELISRNMDTPEATIKGHLDQGHKKNNSTQTNEVITEITNVVIPLIFDPTEKYTQIYQDNFLLNLQK